MGGFCRWWFFSRCAGRGCSKQQSGCKILHITPQAGGRHVSSPNLYRAGLHPLIYMLWRIIWKNFSWKSGWSWQCLDIDVWKWHVWHGLICWKYDLLKQSGMHFLLFCLAWDSCESPLSNERELSGRNKIITVWCTWETSGLVCSVGNCWS